MPTVYEEVKSKMLELCLENNLFGEKIVIRARTLTPEEAIGNPEGDDFPLKKGKERLMEAEFRGALGQAFTDRFGDYEGTLEEIFTMPLKNNYRRALFVAALNAVLRHLGLIGSTVHCRDEGPAECAAQIASFIRDRVGISKITQIGFQPAIAEALAKAFPFRLLDLDPDNIGRKKFGIVVEGPEATEEAVAWADLLLVTGTTITNDTIGRFLNNKPTIFYGTTVAGAAYLMGWDRFCAASR
jgi:hypothetical protein